jgi:hypothetical protein
MAPSSDYVKRFTEGELMRLLFHLEKSRARSRRYYQRNMEARKATNMERYRHRKQAQKRTADAEAEKSA